MSKRKKNNTNIDDALSLIVQRFKDDDVETRHCKTNETEAQVAEKPLK